jgi:hypothetical protein
MMQAPRNEALLMRSLYESGIIAPIIPSRDQLTQARHKKVTDSRNVQMIRERSRNESDRSNHKMRIDELKEDLRTGRMPNMRAAGSEMANLERLVTQLDTRIEES